MNNEEFMSNVANNQNVVMIDLIHMMYNAALILNQYNDIEARDYILSLGDKYLNTLSNNVVHTECSENCSHECSCDNNDKQKIADQLSDPEIIKYIEELKNTVIGSV